MIPESSESKSNVTPLYWDKVLEDVKSGPSLETWRTYMRFVYRKLITSWLSGQNGIVLKTDLFEEAVSRQCPLIDLGNGSIGFDGSLEVVRAARRQFDLSREHKVIVCDLRNLAFKSNSFNRILSGSSLDHFEKKADFLKALSELARILAPGGILALVLDNPLNPVIWLRNHLPFQWLNRLGLVPYFVGVTCGINEGRQQLESLGLKVTHVKAVAHVPRAPAIFLTWIGERWKWHSFNRFVERVMETFEKFGNWPTSNLTGYYLAFRVEKSIEKS